MLDLTKVDCFYQNIFHEKICTGTGLQLAKVVRELSILRINHASKTF